MSSYGNYRGRSPQYGTGPHSPTRGGRNNSGWTSARRPSNTAETRSPADRDLFEGLVSDSVVEISVPSAGKADDLNIEINDCQYVGSYTWTDRDIPTIIVPGAPRQWTNRAPPFLVQGDQGRMFVDQNGHRMPKTPFLPLIAAVTTRTETGGHSPFDWAGLDFITDRNALRKLVRWVKGGTDIKDFRIDLELAGEKTVLMNRWEKRTTEYFNGRSFGFNFEKATTNAHRDCREGTGHHRIVTYDLNGIKMVVRFEVDACIPQSTAPAGSAPVGPSQSADIDDLIAGLASAQLGDTTPDSNERFPGLKVVQGGYEVKEADVMELSTRAERWIASYDFTELYPQLFFSQTAHHIMGLHDRGNFKTIQKRALKGPDLQKINTQMQSHFRAVRKALEEIQDLVVDFGEGGRLSLVCQGGVLRVYARTGDDRCLPDHLLELFK